MREQSVRDRGRDSALVSINFAFAAAIHDAAIEIEPSTFRIHSPAHGEVRFVPRAGIEPYENEARDVVRGLIQPPPLHWAARFDVVCGHRDAESAGKKCCGFASS